MVERLQEPRDERQKLGIAYSSFRKLIQKHGQPSEEGGYTIKRYITVNESESYLIQGRFFGVKSQSVEIFYRKGKNAAQVILAPGLAGEINVSQSIVFEQKETPRGNILIEQHDKKPDIDVLIELLQKAEKSFIIEAKRTKSRRDVALRLGGAISNDLKRKKEERDRRRHKS